MGEIPFPSAKNLLAAALVAAGLGLGASSRLEAGPLRDVPIIWHDDDRRPIPEPAERDPSVLWEGPKAGFKRPTGRFLDPVRQVRRIGVLFGADHVPPAANVNTLDEVPNSSWFTNRIGLFPMTPEQARRGPGTGTGPDQSGPWTVTRAKTEGVTPGFTIRDAAGKLYLIKFDPPDAPNIASAAGVISGLLLHAAGFNVPDDTIVYFRREDLRLGEGVRITLPDKSKRPMTEADVDDILERVRRGPDGTYRAVSSRFLSGKPLGPFDYKGTRSDDPNDRVPHQDRRELRGLRMFAAWINHFDTKQQNSLDMYVEDGEGGYVRHNLIDFASTLGTGALGPSPRQGQEYSLDGPAILGRTLALGFHESTWRKLQRPELAEVGYLESRLFDPLEFKSLLPNSAFVNMTDRDGYWAAKIISAFTDAHLEAIVSRGRYDDPRAAEYVARVMGERRDKIAGHFFERIAPLEFFSWEGNEVRFHDLGHERNIFLGTTPGYRYRVAALDEGRSAASWSPWVESRATELPIEAPTASVKDRPFLAVEVSVDRGAGWSPSVTAYFSRTRGTIVAVDR